MGSENGLAVRDGNGWTLSPNLRGLLEGACDAILKRSGACDAILKRSGAPTVQG